MESSSEASGSSKAAEPPRSERLVALFAAGERSVNAGCWEWNPRTDSWLWSDNMYRLFGFAPDQVAPSQTALLQRLPPADRDRVLRHLERARDLSRTPSIDIAIEHPDLGVHYLRSTITSLDSDRSGPTRIVGVIRDVTREHMTKQEAAARLGVSKTLADWDGQVGGAVRLLGELGRALELRCGTLWFPEDGALVPAALWSEPGVELAALTAATTTLRCPPGIALPGRSWQSKRTEILVDLLEDELPRRRLAATEAGLRSAIAFPALHQGEVIAVFEFYHGHSPDLIARLLPTIAAIGGELGEFFSHRGGELANRYLTARQSAVLMLAAAGNSAPQIAEKLGISSSTVRTHFDHVYEKLGVADRAAAVAQGLRLGLIQ